MAHNARSYRHVLVVQIPDYASENCPSSFNCCEVSPAFAGHWIKWSVLKEGFVAGVSAASETAAVSCLAGAVDTVALAVLQTWKDNENRLLIMKYLYLKN